MTLEQFFKEHPRCALGYSGGVDSSYLLWAAVQAGINIQPYFIKTPFQPEFELEDAKKMARELGVDLRVVPLRLPEPVLENPSNRCYLCKQALFGTLRQMAAREGYGVLLDGTNASDDPKDRPGMRALEELEVLSPLRLCGLTKEELRRRSREAGLFTWDKPAYACLATRFPTGTKITETGLPQVETAEGLLFSLGFTDFRVRVFHGAARLQLPSAQMEGLLQNREAVLAALGEIFSAVLLDLEGRA